jgi:imidazolonepropionase
MSQKHGQCLETNRKYGACPGFPTLEAGKQADLIILDVPDYREIPYYFAMNHCVTTVKRGKVVYSR